MTLKIIERQEKEFLRKIQQVRKRLVAEEARRFGAFKGGGNQDQWEQDFLHKIESIRTNIPDTPGAQNKARSVEATIREKETRSVLSFGNLDPGVILDLL